MERTQIIALMSELKLYGMKTAYDEIMAAGIKRQHVNGGVKTSQRGGVKPGQLEVS